MRFLRLPALLATLFALPAFAASTLTGTVTNGTSNKPSSGDTVTLIRLAQGMQEATHTTTDSKGRYTLDVPDEGIHLVRVTHEGANYFKPAPPGTQSVDIDVYEVGANVKGVELEADVMRLQSEPDGKSLRIVQHFFLKNDSAPPKTMFSGKTFDFTLPEGAIVAGAAAQGPGGMTVQSQPVPLAARNHYSFNFAVRPGGQTQFQVSYTVPYTGTLKLQPTTAMAAANVVVMMPKSMKFDGGTAPWVSVTEETDAQTYVARNVAAGSPTGFTVSGTGELPRQTATSADGSTGQSEGGPAAAGAGPEAAGGGPAAVDTKPGGGLGQPIDTPDPLSKYKWWIIAGIALAMAGGAGFLLSRPQNAPAVAQSAPNAIESVPAATTNVTATPQTSLLNALRDELFTLESERLTGKITEEHYLKVKPALEIVLANALERSNPQV
jgi:hypothetical protein